MPRPVIPRQVSDELSAITYAPARSARPGVQGAALTLDGLEALRLADLEGLYQEEAARRMGVSRATFARVLTEARRHVADALVNRKTLSISGGPVDPRSSGGWPCPVHGEGQRRGRDCRCDTGGGPPRRHRSRSGWEHHPAG